MIEPFQVSEASNGGFFTSVQVLEQILNIWCSFRKQFHDKNSKTQQCHLPNNIPHIELNVRGRLNARSVFSVESIYCITFTRYGDFGVISYVYKKVTYTPEKNFQGF